MKKILPIIIIMIILGVTTYFFLSNNNQPAPNSSETQIITSPQRPAEINGTIVSALGNEIKIANEVNKVILTEEEQAVKKAEFQKLSQEERSATRQEEKEGLETEEITITIPVGVLITKGTGDASGNVITTDIADLTKGVYISAWTNQNEEVEYVKIKGV
jgi:hypothetical protein